jgi:hypothetical protein
VGLDASLGSEDPGVAGARGVVRAASVTPPSRAEVIKRRRVEAVVDEAVLV